MSSRHVALGAGNPRHASAIHRHTLLRVLALGMTAVLAFVGAGAATAYFTIQGNIKSADVTGLLGNRPTPPPGDPDKGRALNVLLLGSDVRNGENGAIGGTVSGMRSDTAILMHISADRSRVELVSIPRDSWVTIPPCLRSNGTTSGTSTTKFNAAFSIGAESGKVTDAAACTIKTVESLTHVFIDDFVVIDFTGFIGMVNALGGVPICIPNDMSSPKSGLKVKAGYQTLKGPMALSYARARTGTGLGDGSDTGRISRQQQLLSATIRQAQSKNLLTDAGALYKFLDAATSSLTTSPHLASIRNLVGLALSMRGLQAKNVTFVTVPWTPRGDGANVVWTSAADAIWANIKADRPVNGKPGSPASTTAPTAAPTGSSPSSPATAGSTAANPASVCG